MLTNDVDLEIRNTITTKDKKILRKALNGITGWRFIPIFVIINCKGDYYFICKVKAKNMQMKIAKIYIKTEKDNSIRLLTIEEIL
ncbi:hypothetical protein [Clostridium beijerinckii]|uniref:hypothetical protein n=1 Tax=Clostridium beijerinckii TaxID=1520 RepID=UPI00047EEF4D|nr:hypothetical protein [Clostridium beijerinckii]